MLQVYGRLHTALVRSTDDCRTGIVPDESDEDEIYRLLMPINTLCSLIERMKLDARTIPIVRPAYGELTALIFDCCRSPPIRRGLHEATQHVNSQAYCEALALLRSIAA